jgi:tetratricopeptide (TPR) repeat protein
VVHHLAEGNLPLALHHLQAARQLFEARHGVRPASDAPFQWHISTLSELASVSREMEQFEDTLDYIDARNAAYSPEVPAEKGWALMRLRRYDEARAVSQQGIEGKDPWQKRYALTTLCALEAELQRRRPAYDACTASMKHELKQGSSSPNVFTNAASASLGLLRMDEAERYALDGTKHFEIGNAANPWEDLMILYLAEGRIGEAVTAAREMMAWDNAQPAYMVEQTRASIESSAALFLLAIGKGEEAARLTARSLQRPDRTGFTSAAPEQLQAGAALLDRAALLLAAERLEEEAACSRLWPAWKMRLQARQLRLRAWSSGRRAASLVRSETMLEATLRPYLEGAVAVPNWLLGDLYQVLGPGVAGAALARAREIEDLPEAVGFFDAQAMEAAYLRADYPEALRLARLALAGLPRVEALLRARVSALAGQAALSLGQDEDGLQFLGQALQLDPGVVRRLGLALPTSIAVGEGEMAAAARGALRASPRFTAPTGRSFAVSLSGSAAEGRACLDGPAGESLACATVTARAGEDAAAVGRRLASELHTQAFAPRLDLSQADLRSLDGSTTVARERSAMRLQGILETITGKPVEKKPGEDEAKPE